MLTIKYYSSFKKDFKRIQKRGYDVRKLDEVLGLLVNELPLPEKIPRPSTQRKFYRLQRMSHHT